jgi:hypothetical protein
MRKALDSISSTVGERKEGRKGERDGERDGRRKLVLLICGLHICSLNHRLAIFKRIASMLNMKRPFFLSLFINNIVQQYTFMLYWALSNFGTI